MSDEWLAQVCGLTPPPEPDLAPLTALVVRVEGCEQGAEAVAAIADWLQQKEVVEASASALRVSPSEVLGLLTRLGARRGLKQHADRVLQVLRQLAREQEVSIRRQLATTTGSATGNLAEQLAYPELPPGLTGPPGWSVGPGGVERLVLDKETGELVRVRVASRPILITARLRNLQDGSTALRLEWPWRSRWLHRVVPRGVVMDARQLVSLAGFDAPVHSGNARDLVRFLSDFEVCNTTALPEATVSSVMGWQDRAHTAFLWGRALIRAGSTSSGENIEDRLPARWQEGEIHLLGDAGVCELADGFQASGSWEGWLSVLEAARPYPAVWLAVYAALIPPLMAFLPTLPNFIVDISGETSQGKTTTLRLAASVWGSPDEREGGIIRTWDATRVYIERAASALGSLPLILDDTKRARRPEDVGKTLYDLASGSGRGRGTVGGIRDTGRWRTVLLSTGEAPATNFTNDGGARARTLCLWGSPFGGPCAVEAVQRITLGVLAHHGHAGPRMLRWMLEDERAAGAIREGYAEALVRWTETANGNPVASRAAQYVAGLEAASLVLHVALGVPRPTEAPLALAWAAVCSASEEADRASDALREVLSWATGQQARFWGRVEHQPSTNEAPSGGWLGAWDGGDGWSQLAILPTELRGFLARQGYDTDAVLRSWDDRDWLLRESGHRTRKVAVAGRKARCVVLTRAACDLLDAGEAGT